MLTDLSRARQEFLDSAESALLPIVDAHHHFWSVPANPHLWLTELPRIPFRYGDYSAICRDFLPSDYAAGSQDHRILRHVVMEGEWDPRDPLGEAQWMSELAHRCNVPHAMAAQIWLDRDDVDFILQQYRQGPLADFVRSVRHKPRCSPREAMSSNWSATGSMRDDRWRRGYALLERYNLMFELQAPWWHMQEVVELAVDFPSTTIIVNHAGLPATRDKETLELWRSAMGLIADLPNIRIKLSGLGVSGQPWSIEQQRPIVTSLITDFGVQRCMFASNFPVDSLVVSLNELWRCFKELTQNLPPADQLALFCDNAVATYKLQ